MLIEIETKPNASQRTKNRIKEHGPEFTLHAHMRSVQCLEGREAINVKAKDGWIGWLPTEEINVKKLLEA